MVVIGLVAGFLLCSRRRSLDLNEDLERERLVVQTSQEREMVGEGGAEGGGVEAPRVAT